MILNLIILILAVGLLLYILFGGADFGAGIIEIFAGRHGKDTISNAIAPVWEANHVWLVLIVVILFMGFPRVYSTLLIGLHIPVLAALIGIILRGTAFTFRHYDVVEDNTHKFYNLFFRVSSIITPFFLGVTTGAAILGRLNLQGTSFYGVFIAPWLNLFSITMGLFTCALFAWLAAVFLIGESRVEAFKKLYAKYAKAALGITVFLGAAVFLSAYLDGLDLKSRFWSSNVSIGAFVLATLGLPLLWNSLNNLEAVKARVIVGAQISLVIVGWFAIQFPVIINMSAGKSLTFYNTQAPEATLIQLLKALIVGVLIILPSIFYLFKVFKFNQSGE